MARSERFPPAGQHPQLDDTDDVTQPHPAQLQCILVAVDVQMRFDAVARRRHAQAVQPEAAAPDDRQNRFQRRDAPFPLHPQVESFAVLFHASTVRPGGWNRHPKIRPNAVI